MKIMKKYKSLMLPILILLLIISHFIFFHAPQAYQSIYWINAAALITIIVLCLHPKARLPLINHTVDRKATTSIYQYLQVFSLQIGLYALYVGLFFIVSHSNYFVTHLPHDVLNHGILPVIQTVTCYPWPLTCLLAIGFSSLAYRNHAATQLHHVCLPRSLQKNGLIIACIENVGHAATLFFIALTLMTGTLIVVALLLGTGAITHLINFRNSSLLISMAAVYFAIRPTSKNKNLQQIEKNKPQLSFTFLLLKIGIILTILTIVTMANQTNAIAIPSILKPLFTLPPLAMWNMMHLFFWVLTCIPAAMIIARASYGRSIRSIITSALVAPAFFSALLESTSFLHPFQSIVANGTSALAIGLVGCLIVIHTCFHSKNLSSLSHNILTPDDQSRQRGILTFKKRLKIILGACLYLFIPLGILGINYLLGIAIIPMIFIGVLAVSQTPYYLRVFKKKR